MKQCSCKICRYHREFKKRLETVPEESKEFFKDLYERYSMIDQENELLLWDLEKYRKRLKKAVETKSNL